MNRSPAQTVLGRGPPGFPLKAESIYLSPQAFSTSGLQEHPDATLIEIGAGIAENG